MLSTAVIHNDGDSNGDGDGDGHAGRRIKFKRSLLSSILRDARWNYSGHYQITRKEGKFNIVKIILHNSS